MQADARDVAAAGESRAMKAGGLLIRCTSRTGDGEESVSRGQSRDGANIADGDDGWMEMHGSKRNK